FEKPNSIADFAKNNFNNNNNYIAIYIPGGHGVLLDLPNDENAGNLVKWAFKKELFLMAICHGPAALLSAKPASDTEPFIYYGYKVAAFPDKMDKQIPLIGYMP